MNDRTSEVQEAAARLVAAFGAHDVRAYFDAFAPEATFLFYTSMELLPTRAAYEAEWRTWEESGFRVLGCESSNGRVQMIGDEFAVFTHDVATRNRDADGEHDLRERETIAFRRTPGGRWLGVHEHLSAAL